MSTIIVETPLLKVTLMDEGPREAPVVFLLHGWPDDAGAWGKIAPVLHEAGYRTITPYFRGFGPTQFLSAETIRDGRGFALTQDVIDIADKLEIKNFAVAGHDWGARVAYMLAGLFPDRVICIAALALAIQPGGKFMVPSFSQSRRFWYQWFMSIDAGAEAVRKDPVGFARIQWDTWSPEGWFTEEEFRSAAESFKNPDWASISLSGYRTRFLKETVDNRYQQLEENWKGVDTIDVPTLMIQGGADTCDEPDSSDGLQDHFKNGYQRVVLNGIGHFPLREDPAAVSALLIKHFKTIPKNKLP